MKILDRYLIRSFSTALGVSLGIFVVLVMLGRYIDRMSIFNEYHAHAKDVVLFLIYSVPYWLNTVFPIGTMLALLFSLGHLHAGGEITAMKSAGIRPSRLFQSYFIIAIAISVFSLIAGLTFAPRANYEARKIYVVKIRQRDLIGYQRDNIIVSGHGHRKYTIGRLDIETNQMHGIVVDQFDDTEENLLRTWVAKSAVFEKGHWRLVEGVERTFQNGDLAQAHDRPFASQLTDIDEKPDDFALSDRALDTLTHKEFKSHLRRLQNLGSPAFEERVDYLSRFAMPWANLVVVLLAIPIALRDRHQTRAQTFMYALGAAFLFWGLTSLSHAVGYRGRVPPWVAAWFSNVFFIGWGLWRWMKTPIG